MMLKQNITMQRNRLTSAREKGSDERYIRMVESTLRRLETELSNKVDDLEKLRVVYVESNEVSAGILEVAPEIR